jgi:hypothetical protein
MAEDARAARVSGPATARRREKHNDARRETFACHMVKATAKARNTPAVFAARLMQNPYMLRIWQKLRALGVAATGDFGGSDRAFGLLGWLLNTSGSLALSSILGGETMGTPQICPQQLMDLGGSGQFWYFPRCKRSSGAFSISGSHGARLSTRFAPCRCASLRWFVSECK